MLVLSYAPARNLLRRQQLMNFSFNPIRLVNAIWRVRVDHARLLRDRGRGHGGHRRDATGRVDRVRVDI
ncbi:MAG TPA: hypothetical protein VF942_00165, partial [Acidimicrobiales bacterium]